MLRNIRRSAPALALAALFASAWVAQTAAAQAALDFRLKTTDGGEITSEMVRGDVVVLGVGS